MTALTALRSSLSKFIHQTHAMAVIERFVLQLSHDVNLHVNISYLAYYCYLHHCFFSLVKKYFHSFNTPRTASPPLVLLISPICLGPWRSWTMYKPFLPIFYFFHKPYPSRKYFFPPVSSDHPAVSSENTAVSFFSKKIINIYILLLNKNPPNSSNSTPSEIKHPAVSSKLSRLVSSANPNPQHESVPTPQAMLGAAVTAMWLTDWTDSATLISGFSA